MKQEGGGTKAKKSATPSGDDQNTNTALVYRVVIARQMGRHLRPVVGKGDRERKCQSNHKRLLDSPDQGLMYAVGAVGARHCAAACRSRPCSVLRCCLSQCRQAHPSKGHEKALWRRMIRLGLSRSSSGGSVRLSSEKQACTAAAALFSRGPEVVNSTRRNPAAHITALP